MNLSDNEKAKINMEEIKLFNKKIKENKTLLKV